MIALALMASAVAFDRCKLAYPAHATRHGAQAVVEVDTGWTSYWWIFTWWGGLRFTVGAMKVKDQFATERWISGLAARGLLSGARSAKAPIL